MVGGVGPCEGNYLRVRGEYLRGNHHARSALELPPRARRIPQGWGWFRIAAGNYLRVRGEYFRHGHMPALGAELPPRARRIRYRLCFSTDHGGTTSACAENTYLILAKPLFIRNYLRVRGEYPAHW